MRRLLITTLLLILFSSFSVSQIVNGNFESGRNNGWTEASQGGYTLIGTGNFFASTEIQPAVNPRSGQWMGRIGGFNYEINAIGQTVTLPNVTPLYLIAYLQSRTSTNSECAGLYVGAKVAIIVNTQEVYYEYLCHYNDYNQWTFGAIDLSAIAGQTAQIIFKAESANSVWSFLYIDDVSITNSLSDAEDYSSPLTIELRQNYPNPFNPATSIPFTISAQSFVSMKVYDTMGREVATVVSEELPAGDYMREWNASGLPSGIYFCRMQAGSYTETRKLSLIK